MAKKNLKEEYIPEEKQDATSGNPLTGILKNKEHKDEHFNFQERVNWKISTGSLLLDVAMEGGVSPSLIRICGGNNEGKTPESLEIIRNFLKDVPNSKAFWMIAEGRGLSKENIDRCGLTFVYDPDQWELGTVFVLESNVYELFIKCVKECVLNNPNKHKYAFCVDSIDGLQLRDDKAKEITENNRVAGSPALSKKMLQSLSLGMFKYGHLMILLSQVTSEIKLDPYQKTANRGGQFSGGNALLHAADYILEFQTSYGGDYIMDNPSGKLNDGKSKPIGKYCSIVLQKSAQESSRKQKIQYPIKFGRKPSGIWLEYECVDMLLAFSLLEKAGSWLSWEKSLLEELIKVDKDIPETMQGVNNARSYLEGQPKVTQYLLEKFKQTLMKN